VHPFGRQINRPRTLSRYQYDPPCPEPTHTFLKVSHPIGGKQIAVSTDEERARRAAVILVHEMIHHYDNMMGLGPTLATVGDYERRAYYAQAVVTAMAQAGELDLPEPFVFAVTVPERRSPPGDHR
jgi:hypothetical protein